MESAWTLSSSEEDEAGMLPAPSTSKLCAQPCVKRKQLKQPVCPFGRLCNMKNPTHLKMFFHLSKKHNIESESECVPKKKSHIKFSSSAASDLLKLWTSSAPNNFFLTNCNGIPADYNYSKKKVGVCSMGIQDILSEDFGVLKESVQFNYCIDIEWLMEQYPPGARDKPLLIVHGEQGSGSRRLQAEAAKFPNIRLCSIQLPPYGTHHTKMMLLHYYDTVRIVISTANLVSQDWDKKSQGFYMSPLFFIKDSKQTDNQSKFKIDLLEYLQAYKKKHLEKWIEVVENADISHVDNIRLVASVPGRHSGPSLSSWGHMKLRNILSNEVKPIDSSWPVIGQFSSIGSLGPSKDKWLCAEWLTSLSAFNHGKRLSDPSKTPPLKLIFPAVDDVRFSLEGYPAGASLPYSSANARKQQWLLQFLHRWQAAHVGRTHASPHIKSYIRISPYDTNIRAAWFLLTSANLSKAAWGTLEKKSTQLYLRSYELGVLFLPQVLSASPEQAQSSSNQIQDNYFHIDSPSKYMNKLCLPFSFPLTPYSAEDEPWTWDAPHTDKPDRHGNVWIPSL